jgi:hypothetical protein
MKATASSKSDTHILRLFLIGVTSLAVGTVIAIALSSIQESFVFSGKPTTTTTLASGQAVQIPSFIDPLRLYTINGVFIGIFLTVGFFALLSAFRKRRASKKEAHALFSDPKLDAPKS